MLRRRRLTALIASLLLVPSIATAGAGCVMRGGAPGGAAVGADHTAHLAASAHRAGHESHAIAPDDASSDDGGTLPAGLPHAPAQCVSIASCTVAAVITEDAPLDGLPHAGERVAAGVVLAPDAPALALEPPPPRA